jgi:hypothetical protein
VEAEEWQLGESGRASPTSTRAVAWPTTRSQNGSNRGASLLKAKRRGENRLVSARHQSFCPGRDYIAKDNPQSATVVAGRILKFENLQTVYMPISKAGEFGAGSRRTMCAAGENFMTDRRGNSSL